MLVRGERKADAATRKTAGSELGWMATEEICSCEEKSSVLEGARCSARRGCCDRRLARSSAAQKAKDGPKCTNLEAQEQAQRVRERDAHSKRRVEAHPTTQVQKLSNPTPDGGRDNGM
jgi:hypothetical protein